jgi:hypothetical protein
MRVHIAYYARLLHKLSLQILYTRLLTDLGTARRVITITDTIT